MTEPTPPVPRPRRSWQKRFLLLSAALLLLLALAGLVVWQYLRSENFNQYVVAQIKAKLLEFGLRGEVGGFGISWDSRTARLRDVKVYNQQTGQLVATLKSAIITGDMRDPFAPKLSRELVFSKLELDGAELFYEVDEQGRTNLDGLRNAPSTSKALTFDTTQLLTSLANGAIHIKDRQHNLSADITQLQATAQPLPQNAQTMNIRLNTTSGNVRYQDRQAALKELSLAARVNDAGADIESLALKTSLGDLNANGKLTDWAALRYALAYEANANLTEIGRTFLPGETLTGALASQGRVEGKLAEYQLSANVNADDLQITTVRLRNVQIPQLALTGNGAQGSFSTPQVRAGSLAVDIVTINNIALNQLKGEFKDAQTQITVPSANVANVAWPESTLSNLSLAELVADVNGAKYEINAAARLPQGSINGAALNDFTAKAKFDNTALYVTEAKGNLFGGTAQADYTLPLARGAAMQLKASFADVQTSDVLTLLKFTDVPVTGKANGEAELSWLGKNLNSIRGNAKVHFAGQAQPSSDAFPLNGDIAVIAENGAVSFQQLQLTTDATKLIANGQLAFDGQSDLRVLLTSSRAEQLLQLARAFPDARPFIEQNEPQLIGDLKFEGTVTGKYDQAVVEGELRAATVGLRDALLGALSGHIWLSPQEARVSNGLLAASNGGTAKFELAAPLDPKAQTGTLNATLERIDLEAILAAVGAPDVNDFVSGVVSGNAQLSGLPGALKGQAQIALLEGRIADQPAELAQAQLKFDSETARLEQLEVKLPQSRITAEGSLRMADYSFQLHSKADQVGLESLAQALAKDGELKNTRIEGTADADLVVTGKILTGKKPDLDWESLQLTFLAQGQHVKVNGRDTGELRLAAKTSPGGRLDISLVTGILATLNPADKGRTEALTGSIELRQPGRPITLSSKLDDLKVAPLLEIFAPGLSNTLAGSLDGTLQLSGPTVDPNGNSAFDKLRGTLTLTDLALTLAETPVQITAPVTITFANQQITLPDTPVVWQGVDVHIGGVVGLTDAAAMNFALNGTVNFDRMSPLSTDTLLFGKATIDAKLQGSAEAPKLSGQVNVTNFGLSSGTIPIYFSAGTGRLTLADDQLKLEKFTAKANDGNIEISGTTKLAQLLPSEWRYELKADNVDFIYQELSATVNGSLTLTGTPQGQSLAGTLTVPQAEYDTSIDLDNLLAGGSGNGTNGFGDFGGGGTQSLAIPPVSLAVRISAPDSLIVRGEQVNAVGSALLTLNGSLNDPNLTGRIESDGGLVRFRGQRYEITRGALDLPPGGNATPVLDLLAEGEVSGYRVYIGFVGQIDELELTLTTEPQLARTEILSLITTGRTEGSSLAGQDPLLSGVGAAASLISSGLISKPTEQLLGLSRFQIDPVIRPNANPAARLTVGQQLSRDFYLSYSTNLATEQDQTALAEYTLSNRFSALATFTQGGSSARQLTRDNVLTIELRGRQRFALGFKPEQTTPANADPRDALARITRAKLPQALVEVSPVPDLKFSKIRLRELLPVMTQGYSQSLRRLGERRLREYLQEHGYFFAEVSSRCVPENCEGEKLQLFYDITPNTVYDLKEIRLEGTQVLKFADVAGELQSQPASQVGGVPFLKDLPLIGGYVRGLTSSERLNSDEETIRRKLVDIGFRSARVKSRLAVKPDNDELIVIFAVEEGVQSDIGDVVVRGNTIVDARELRDAVPIKPGEAFSYTRARGGAQLIRQRYAELGFLEANAELQIVELDADSVQLVYQVSEGERAVVSEIEINGTTKTGKGWVRRYFDFKPGDILTPAKIRQTQRNLYATNAFREVNVKAEALAGGDGAAHKVQLNVTEAKPLLFVYGLGYSSDDGARGLMEIANTNLGGSLDSLTLRLRASGRDQFAQLAFTDLRPFGTRLPTTISTSYNRTSNLRPFVRQRVLDNGVAKDDPNARAFGLERFAAFIQTERKLADRTSVRLRYNFERANLLNVSGLPSTEITRNEGAIRLGAFSAGLTHDTRDSVLNPTRGQLFSADHSLAAKFLGGNESFNKFFGTYQTYHTFSPFTPVLGNVTLAFSGRVGLAANYRNTDRDRDGQISDSEQRLPISERFFSGGATTLRGFRFETAGPQALLGLATDAGSCADPNRDPSVPCGLPTLVPIGGDALAIFNFELRYPLSQRLRLVPFYDVGNVFRRVHDIRFSNMTNTVGLGLRINTPLGPIGVDYGFLLDPPAYQVAPGSFLRQPRGAFHIRFGQSF